MRGKFAVLALTALIILGLSASQALAVNSVTYLGKTTWTIYIDDSYPDATKIGKSFTLTGGVSKVGDEFYLFQGYVASGTDGPFVLSGSGFLMNGSTLVFTLSTSQQHTSEPYRDSGVMHVNIDKTSLNGTFYGLDNDFNTSTRTIDPFEYTAGTLTLSGPPIPMAPALAGSQQLLLLDH